MSDKMFSLAIYIAVGKMTQSSFHWSLGIHWSLVQPLHSISTPYPRKHTHTYTQRKAGLTQHPHPGLPQPTQLTSLGRKWITVSCLWGLPRLHHLLSPIKPHGAEHVHLEKQGGTTVVQSCPAADSFLPSRVKLSIWSST